jgi:uncharacterized protein with HEPN domain
MSRHETDVRLRHMLDGAREAVALVQGKSRPDLDTDRMLNLALVRLLEVIGEAANRVPDDEQSQHYEIEWAQIISLRNRLIHGYDDVDFDILWQIVTSDLPALIKKLENILGS